MNSVYLSTLGRDVKVGCLYNYSNAAILPGDIEIPSENVMMCSDDIGVDDDYETISFDVSEKDRISCIGINQHLSRQMHAKKLKMNHFWFYNYMRDKAFANCNNNNEVHITVYLYFARKCEILDDEFVDSNIARYCANKYGGTHLVQEVVYGAEFILWMHKPVDPSKETKDIAEETLRSAVKTYTRHFFYSDPDPPSHDDVLNSMACSFQSNIHNCHMSNGTFLQCIRFIKELLNTEKNKEQQIWRPTRMRLCRIPTIADIEMANDLHTDTALKLKVMRKRIAQKGRLLADSPSLRHVSFLKTLLVDFINKLLKPITSKINNKVDELRGQYYSPKNYSSITQPYVKLLEDMLRWLRFFKRNMEKIDLVLKENSLPVLDLRSMNELMSEGDFGDLKSVEVFVLHSNCAILNASDERFKEWAMDPNCNPPMFYVQTKNGLSLENIREEFQVFLNKAKKSASNGIHYVVGILSPKSPYKEGSVFTMSFEESMPAVVDKPGSSCAAKELPAVTNGKDCAVDSSIKCQSNALSDATLIKDSHDETKSKETECVPAGTRVCEEFARTDRKHSQLLNTRPPNIFLLNAQGQFVLGNFRWYEIGLPSQEIHPPPDHKVILLMGATGCGKSTLIDAMVNYFLGVRYADSFRFKIVRDESTGNRTTSVTAYTIYHRPGMAVPYSITIIDTPGYGNPRGVERDKEITSTIHEFLTFNQFDRVMKIHAACFIATYGESQLTKSQRYIIDSMLSIFGKDIKEKIQLVVTFADNHKPPVVQAYVDANFPASSHPVEISYYKFNSGLLYEDNSFPGFEDGKCIEEYFWDLERKNFEKFFDMLKEMDDRDVKPIRRWTLNAMQALELQI